MASYKSLILLLLTAVIISCGDQKQLINNYSIKTSAAKNAVKNGGEISLSLTAKKNFPIDSIIYNLDGKKIATTTAATNFKTALKSNKLGRKELMAQIYTSEGITTATATVILLNNVAPKVYDYKIVNRFPHKTDAYTQGLEFVGDDLYESNGQYGQSNLRKLNYETGEILEETKLDNQYFAEGITVVNDKIYQLTWRENVGFIYDLATLEKTGTFHYQKSKEGWGICNNGKKVYKSDGTSKIWILDPENLSEQNYIEATDDKSVRKLFNELEYINGKIYANYYQLPLIAIINPETGAIEGNINLIALPKEVQSGLDKDNEVLNGIAYKANEDRLFVTGKHWNTLFEIEISEK